MSYTVHGRVGIGTHGYMRFKTPTLRTKSHVHDAIAAMKLKAKGAPWADVRVYQGRKVVAHIERDTPRGRWHAVSPGRGC